MSVPIYEGNSSRRSNNVANKPGLFVVTNEMVNNAEAAKAAEDAAFYKEFIIEAHKNGWYEDGGVLEGKYGDDMELFRSVAGDKALGNLREEIASGADANNVVASTSPDNNRSPLEINDDDEDYDEWSTAQSHRRRGGGNNGGNNGNHGRFSRFGKRAIAAGATALFAVGAWLGGSAWHANNQHDKDQAALDALNNAPAAIETADDLNDLNSLNQIKVQIDTATAYVADRDANPSGAWWDLFDGVKDPSAMSTAYEKAGSTIDNVNAAIAEEQANIAIEQSTDDVRNQLNGIDPSAPVDARATTINGLASSLDAANEQNSTNPDNAKDSIQVNLDTAAAELSAAQAGIEAEKLGVSVEDYNSYNAAANKMGLSIEDTIKYAQQYGVPASVLGTPDAMSSMTDNLVETGNVSEKLSATTAEQLKSELVFIAYNNPSTVAQYMTAINEDTYTDAAVDGLETPSKAEQLREEYLQNPDKYASDLQEFKDLLKDATVDIRQASGAMSVTYGANSDGSLYAANVAENSYGLNDTVYVVTINHNGITTTLQIKGECGQLTVEKAVETVYAVSSAPVTQYVSYATPETPSYTPETPTTWVPWTPDEPNTPDEPDEPEPETPTEELDEKDNSQNPVVPEQGSAHNSGDDATVNENEEAQQPAGDYSGEESTDQGNEYQPEDPSQDDNFSW